MSWSDNPLSVKLYSERDQENDMRLQMLKAYLDSAMKGKKLKLQRQPELNTFKAPTLLKGP